MQAGLSGPNSCKFADGGFCTQVHAVVVERCDVMCGRKLNRKGSHSQNGARPSVYVANGVSYSLSPRLSSPWPRPLTVVNIALSGAVSCCEREGDATHG